MTGGIRTIRTSLAGTLLLLLMSACQGSDSSADSTERTAAAYSVIIDDLLRRQPIEPAEGSELPVVYIEAFADEGISLEVQVLVVANLAEQLEIRFIDDVVEATDQDLDTHPVKSGSVLIGVGPVPEAPVEVQVEWYDDRETVMAYRYALTPRGASSWIIAGERASTEPVGFVQSS